jgi:hypothetical protein
MPFVKVFERDEAQGRLKEVYEDLIAWRSGCLPPPFKGIGLNPEAVLAVKQLNLACSFGASSLGVRREEMLVTFISRLNECDY